MTPENAKFLTQVMGQQLQTEWMSTYKVIAAVPDDKKDFKPQADQPHRIKYRKLTRS